MNKFLIIVLMIGLAFQFCQAQKFVQSKLDSFFYEIEVNNKFMGTVAVSQNGNVIYSKSLGFSDVEKKIKINENSKFRIGSISKTFTTVLVMKAVEQKKLDLDLIISKFFPAIKNCNKISIRHLLNHRSGIPNFTSKEEYLTWNTQPKSESEMVEIIAKNGSDFEPDTKSEYSNSNFVLLTYILEKTYNKKYSELLQDYICKPIGLKNTYLGGKINPSNNECKSYTFAGDWKEESETDISIPLGAGGIVSTATDLVKFSDALFGGKLLEKESLEMMKTMKDNYGLGLFQIPFYDKTGYGHTGGIDGFSSVFSYFSDGNISYCMISNGANYNTNNISIAVLSAIYDKPYDILDFSSVRLSAEDLDKYLGVYSSVQLPLKITISKVNTTLMAQATGQPSFPLEPTAKDIFQYEMAGVVIEFDVPAKSFILKQGGGVYKFTRD